MPKYCGNGNTANLNGKYLGDFNTFKMLFEFLCYETYNIRYIISIKLDLR